VPRPLSRVRIEYGEPRWVERGADRRTVTELARDLGHTLNALTKRVGEEEGA